MAARVDPMHASARHQALHHFVAKAEWSHEELLRRVCEWVIPKMDFAGGGWWIIDDTGFPKKGRHSVGVARQYCGMLGKQDNCQVAVSISLASNQGSLPVAWQLYLPEDWAAEGRGWRGFHHHAALSIAAYGFLMAERLVVDKSISGKKNFVVRQVPAVPKDYIPRGSPERAAARGDLDHDAAPAPQLSADRPARAVPLLRQRRRQVTLVTQ